MKYLLKVVFTLIAAALFTAASAQNTGAYLKFDINGKTISIEDEDLAGYNNFIAGDKDKKTNNEHAFYVAAAANHSYKMDIMIHTPPHTNPVAGKLPYVPTTYKPGNPTPGVYIGLNKTMGDDFEFYGSKKGSVGYFEITKVADGWVEGKFEIKISDLFDDAKVLHLTNGTFRFEIGEEVQY
ncbi:hypothetical protein DBR32_11275 [Taibaiella sp. KBW10]|uniref:hypothetical protein n=1 Tax=Taibaiella sp. KBW10 TaxID=2153357 RepID=UPI000F5AEDD3|nr:hypothetical protein [Taibaiella sp. KBW10]RQO30159.1 hypothetical protein DBR32_11275 [Taibaiella sp. KBW10]